MKFFWATPLYAPVNKLPSHARTEHLFTHTESHVFANTHAHTHTKKGFPDH